MNEINPLIADQVRGLKSITALLATNAGVFDSAAADFYSDAEREVLVAAIGPCRRELAILCASLTRFERKLQ